MRRTHRPATVVALLLSMFMAATEMTVVSTAMPTVVSELGGALHYGWVFSAYMLAQTVLTPIYGKLADLYGRKPVMLVAMAIFLTGSIACGRASTMLALVASRTLQGIGAGGLQPIAMTIIGDIFELNERARMQGVFGAVWGVAGLAGPMLGGFIVTALSWRWVFYVNVPFGLLSAIVLSTALVEDVEKRNARLDLRGALLSSLTVVALLLGVEGVAPHLLLPASLVGVAAFVYAELRAPEPMLPPRLFLRPLLAVVSVASMLTGGILFGLATFVPLYAQGVLAASPTAAGATIAPMVVAWPVASSIGGRLIARFGFRPLVRIGFVLVALGTLLLALETNLATRELKIYTAAIGFGMGIASPPLLIAIQTSVAFGERGVVTASTMFFRTIGGTVGVGVMGAVLARTLLANPMVQSGGGQTLVAQLLSPARRGLDPGVLASIAGDLARGIGRVTLVCAALGLASVVVAWLFPSAKAKPAS